MWFVRAAFDRSSALNQMPNIRNAAARGSPGFYKIRHTTLAVGMQHPLGAIRLLFWHRAGHIRGARRKDLRVTFGPAMRCPCRIERRGRPDQQDGYAQSSNKLFGQVPHALLHVDTHRFLVNLYYPNSLELNNPAPTLLSRNDKHCTRYRESGRDGDRKNCAQTHDRNYPLLDLELDMVACPVQP